ncbi:MAG: NAD-dependent epimerase/dehydratase family protein [Promethearchaeota archaeon]
MRINTHSNMKRILITGDEGFIGKKVVEKLSALEIPWIGFDITRGEDILDFNQLEAISNIKTIIHLAGITDRNFALKYPQETQKINVLGTFNVLELARKTKAKVIFASSSLVYGDSYSHLISEDCERKPMDPYALSKMLAEDACIYYFNNYRLTGIILRFFNIYGDSLKPGTLISDLLKQILDPYVDIIILRNNSSSRDYVHVRDIVTCIIKCLDVEFSGTFNVGLGRAYRPLDIAEILFDKTKIRKKISIFDRSVKKSIICANIEKIRDTLGFKPEITLEKGLSELIEDIL